MWNGASGARTPSTSASASSNGRCLDEGAVARRVHVREVDHRSHPPCAAADLDAVVERAEVADPAHHLDAERHRTALALQALPHDCELLDDRRRSRPPGSVRAGTRGGRRRARRRTPWRCRRFGRALRVPRPTCARSPRGGRPSRTAARARRARHRARGPARRVAPPTGSPSRSRTRSRSRRRRSRARARARPHARGCRGRACGRVRRGCALPSVDCTRRALQPLRRRSGGGRRPALPAGRPMTNWRNAAKKEGPVGEPWVPPRRMSSDGVRTLGAWSSPHASTCSSSTSTSA